MLLKDFRPYGIYDMHVVIAVVMTMPLRDFGLYGIICVTVCFLQYIFPLFFTGNLLA
jgi:hypothetical protein